MELITGENDSGRRLDRILRKALPVLSLPLIYKLLRRKKVLIDGVPASAQDRPERGAKITILSLKNIPQDGTAPENFKKNRRSKNSQISPGLILMEENGLLAVNKPAGLSVHGPDSLNEEVRSYLEDKLPPSLSFKPGPLHRLDKPSSGIIVFSASLEGARLFSSLIKEHKVKKTYLAIVEGEVKNETLWHDDLVRDRELKKTFISKENPHLKRTTDSKNALTKVRCKSTNGKYSLIEAEIVTGRTHQIRAQAAHHGHPLAGDVKYGGKKITNEKRAAFFLHAQKLEFLDYEIEAPLPQEFINMIKTLFGIDSNMNSNRFAD